MKASIAGAYYASLFLRERDLPYRLVTAFTVEEETTGFGTREYLSWAIDGGRLDPRRTAAVVTEPTGLSHVSLGNRGAIFAAFKITGRGGHGSRPHLASNPLDAVTRILAALPGLVADWNRRFPDPAFDAYGGTTVTPTSVESGDATRHNVIPEVARFLLDCRMTSGLYRDDFRVLKDELVTLVRAEAGDGFDVEVEFRHPRAGQKIEASEPIAQAALQTLRDDMGIDAEFRHTPAGNDAVYFEARGIPCVNKVGPGHPECAHRVDEYVAVENVLRGVEFFIRLALRWAERFR